MAINLYDEIKNLEEKIENYDIQYDEIYKARQKARADLRKLKKIEESISSIFEKEDKLETEGEFTN